MCAIQNSMNTYVFRGLRPLFMSLLGGGGVQLHVQSVQRILKGVYWLLKRFPNVREVNMTSPDDNLIVRTSLNMHAHGEIDLYIRSYT